MISFTTTNTKQRLIINYTKRFVLRLVQEVIKPTKQVEILYFPKIMTNLGCGLNWVWYNPSVLSKLNSGIALNFGGQALVFAIDSATDWAFPIRLEKKLMAISRFSWICRMNFFLPIPSRILNATDCNSQAVISCPNKRHIKLGYCVSLITKSTTRREKIFLWLGITLKFFETIQPSQSRWIKTWKTISLLDRPRVLFWTNWTNTQSLPRLDYRCEKFHLLSPAKLWVRLLGIQCFRQSPSPNSCRANWLLW